MLRRHVVGLTAAATLAAGSLLAAASAAGTDPTTVTIATQPPSSGQIEGFDACNAPPTSTMRAWLASPYRAVNIYFGGSQRFCSAQPELSASWVTTVLANGWSLIPTYVDLQAPCNSSKKGKMSSDPGTATQQGAAAGQDAIAQLDNLGLAGTIAYLDLEPFDTANTKCVTAVLSFTHAWATTLHGGGYRSGIYLNSNPGRGAEPFVAEYAPGAVDQPDDVWFARYNGGDTTVDEPTIPAGDWAGHRIHQYRGGHDETWGGLTIGVDNDAVDGDVVTAIGVDTPTSSPYTYNVSGAPSTGLNRRQGPTSATPSLGKVYDGDPLAIVCQTNGENVDGDIVWDQLSDGSYVSDLYTTTTGGNDFSGAIERCPGAAADRTPPALTLRPQPVATLAASRTVSWTATDAATGVASYDVRVRSARFSGGFSRWQQVATATQATTQVLALTPGYDSCLSVRARDNVGNVSRWATACVARPLDDRSLHAGSAWTRKTDARYYRGTYLSTARSGRTARAYQARVARVGVVATTCTHCGSLRIYVAGHRVGTISLHASSTHRRRLLLLPPFALRSGTVTVRTLSGQLVQLDGLLVSRT